MALSKHPDYSAFKRAVQRNQVDTMRALRPAFEATEPSLTELSGRALRWAAAAGTLAAMRELLAPEWNAVPTGLMKGELLVDLVRQAMPDTMAESVLGAVMEEMVKKGVALESTEYVTQPLSEAMRRSSRTLLCLLKAGADPDGLYRWKDGDRSGHGNPPLCEAKTLEKVDALLRYGASPGAAPAAMRNGMFGGVYALLLQWEERGRLGELWGVMVRNGITSETLVEGEGFSGEVVSLATAVFERVPDPAFVERMEKLPLGASFRKKYEDHLVRRAQLQETLVFHGFDLNSIASDGRSFAGHVRENGSPQLARMVALDQSLPPPARRAPGPRF